MMDLQISQDGFFLGPILDSPASRLEFPGTHCNLNSVAIVFELNIDPWRRFLNTLAVGEQMQISVPCTPAHAHHLTEHNLLITKETAAKSKKTLLARRAKGQHDGVRFDHPLHHGTMLRYYCYFYHYQPVIVTVTRHRIGRCSGGARRRRQRGRGTTRRRRCSSRPPAPGPAPPRTPGPAPPAAGPAAASPRNGHRRPLLCSLTPPHRHQRPRGEERPRRGRICRRLHQRTAEPLRR